MTREELDAIAALVSAATAGYVAATGLRLSVPAVKAMLADGTARQTHVDALQAQIDALTIRVIAARKVVHEVQNIVTCENLHHAKADQHKFGEACLPSARIAKLIRTVILGDA